MSEPNVRLLQCTSCKSLEELPDYEGDSRADDTLNALVSRHRFPDGTEHIGNLLRIEKKYWDSKSTRRAIENQIRESAGHTGFDTEFYATKNTFQEDALRCFQQHNRNPACPDYRSDRKRLMPDTKAERKAIGAPKYESKTYLCNFCPVQSLVQSARFDKTIR